jgi:phosphomethylpyrimidine synthase
VTQLESARHRDHHAADASASPSASRTSAPEQVRDEIAAGRMIIPANIVHLARTSTRCASGARARPRSTRTWALRPVSSGTDEEVEKLKWAERWGGDTVMDLSTGGDLDA